MNAIDLIILIPLLWAAYIGFKKGLVIEVATLLALAGGIYAGLHFSNYASELLSTKIEAKLLPIVSFAVTFLVVVILIFMLGRLLEKAVNLVALKLVNKVLGAIFGMLKAFVIVSVLLLIFDHINNQYQLLEQKTTAGSVLYRPTVETTQNLLPNLKQFETSSVVIQDKD